jgi:hypothetical protein
MIETLCGWELDVERGPDWLFVKVNLKQDMCEPPVLAERLWTLLQEHFVDRLVLELGEIGVLNSRFLEQLVLLHKRICEHGGLMHLCGLSAGNQKVLRLRQLDGRFPYYHNLQDAVMGCCRPRHPR